MKKCVLILLLFFCASSFVRAQSFEVQQLLLNVEKLSQLRQMLADLKKGYEIVYSGYSTIKNISEGNFHLHQGFLDRLLDVKPAIRNYKKVGEIISLQLRIMQESKGAAKRFRESGRFTEQEIDYLSEVYANLFSQSLKNLDVLLSVITSGALRMSDDERLSQIDALHEDTEDKLTFLRSFNNQSSVLLLQRLREEKDILQRKKIYGIH